MEFNDVKKDVLEILQKENGKFITPYQIFEKLSSEIKDKLTEAYPPQAGGPSMGAGCGKSYSPATFIAKALDYFFYDKNIFLRKEQLSCKGVTFNGTEPGFTGNVISIWAWLLLTKENAIEDCWFAPCKPSCKHAVPVDNEEEPEKATKWVCIAAPDEPSIPFGGR